MKPTKKQSSDVFAVNFDRKISYFRIVGRIAIDSNETKIKGKEVLKVDFEKYIEGYVILDIPTPVGNYSPDWAIAFYEGKVKHIYFVAETKGTMDSLNLKPIEKAKIECAEKLFAQLSSAEVVYERVDSYQRLLDIIGSP